MTDRVLHFTLNVGLTGSALVEHGAPGDRDDYGDDERTSFTDSIREVILEAFEEQGVTMLDVSIELTELRSTVADGGEPDVVAQDGHVEDEDEADFLTGKACSTSNVDGDECEACQ